MKKLFGIAVAFLLFGGCASSPYVWDSSLPEESMATVYFPDLYPTSVNGINLDKIVAISAIKIPAGSTEFLLNSRHYSTSIFLVTDAIFKYNFVAGKTYTVRYNAKEVGGGRLILGVGVYDGTPSKTRTENTLLDVVPFPNIK
jgi:hypothetical protein